MTNLTLTNGKIVKESTFDNLMITNMIEAENGNLIVDNDTAKLLKPFAEKNRGWVDFLFGNKGDADEMSWLEIGCHYADWMTESEKILARPDMGGYNSYTILYDRNSGTIVYGKNAGSKINRWSTRVTSPTHRDLYVNRPIV